MFQTPCAVLFSGAVLLAAWTASAAAQTAPPQQLELQLLASGLNAPAWAGAPPGEPQRLFVLEIDGRVRLLSHGVLQLTPFLDITQKAEHGAQSGLLGMAFHPDFAHNGWFYVYYSISGTSSTLERYTVSATNPDRADPLSAYAMLSEPIVDPAGFHMGGGLAFGPDGKLYLGIGDSRNLSPGNCTAQQLNSLLGKVLRLEDDGGIPADNPFVSVHSARPEIWDLGLREPYRLHFDPLSGDLCIADIGEDEREEVDVHPRGMPGGMNFGWRVLEGLTCTGSAQCATYPCPSPTYVPPTFSYGHAAGKCCILGGGFYQGADVQAAAGAYIYADYCTKQVYALQLGSSPVPVQLGFTLSAGPIQQLSSLGWDTDGELLLIDFGQPPTVGGKLWKLAPKHFQDVGGGLGGPTFSGQGAPSAGTQLNLTLGSALAGGQAWLVTGLDALALPFKGGIMMPQPDVILAGFAVAGNGKLPLSFTWPAGIPAGLPLMLQWWIADASGPQGYTASNALLATTL